MLKLTPGEIRDWSNILPVVHIGAARDKDVADAAAGHAAREICQFVRDWETSWDKPVTPALQDWLKSQSVELE